MATNRRNRDRKPGRRPAFLEPKPRILAVCEGKVTEPQYLRGFSKACHNPRVHIEIAPEAGVPKTVVEMAKRRLKEADEKAKREGDDNLRFEAVWAVFDVDDHPHIPDAIQMARDNSINLAVSNPSFELWLLLHFVDNPGMKDRKAVRGLLKEYVVDYDKHVHYDKDYRNGYELAVQRASKLESVDLKKCTPGSNPSTGVHGLTESIRSL